MQGEENFTFKNSTFTSITHKDTHMSDFYYKY